MVAGREPGGGGAGDAAPTNPVPRVGSGETQRYPVLRSGSGKGYVTRGFGVSVRVLRGSSPDGIRSG